MPQIALLQTYRDYEWELLRFLGKRLGSSSLASDIAHDLYIKILSAKEQSHIRDPRSYLFSMASNLALDHIRVEKRRREILEEAEGIVWRQTDDFTPERHALARAELDYLEAAIAELPARCRQVFFLNRYEGKSHAEISKTLKIGLTTVYKDLKIAMSVMMKARRQFQDLTKMDNN